MQIPGATIVGLLSVPLVVVAVIVLVATAIARARGFQISIDRPGVSRIDAVWLGAMILVLVFLATLAATYLSGW